MQRGWDENLTKLRNILAQLCPREEDSRVWSQEALLNIALICFSSAADTNWHNILEEARKEGKIVNVIDVALSEYKGSRELVDAREYELNLTRQ